MQSRQKHLEVNNNNTFAANSSSFAKKVLLPDILETMLTTLGWDLLIK